jgi:hypothetical protein
MRGKVVNKHARHNVCFDDKSQEANYEAGEGTIIAWEDVPMTARVFSTNWFERAQFAVDHQMSTNFGYVSRPIQAFVKAEDARVGQELSSGKLDPGAIYLVSNRADWIMYQKQMGNNGDAYELDGFFVLVGN